jgi:surfactin synthase thioesterase subunit
VTEAKPISASPTDWFVRFTESPAAPVTLVCFPHAGGSASFYFPLARRLAPEVDVVGVQYPGRQERRGEPLIDRIDALADRIAAVLPEFPGRRLVFLGHSMGASVAFEVARRLEAGSGPRPERLLASAGAAPSAQVDRSVHRRSDAGLVQELAALSGTTGAILADPEVLAAVLPVVRADYTAIETYHRPVGTAVSCPVLALAADADPITSVRQARAWAHHTTGSFGFHLFDGGHFYLENWPVEVVTTIRTAVLDRTPVRVDG